jgi:hypothetical protein
VDHSTPARHLYGDAAGRWAIITMSADRTPPPYLDLGTPGPHIPLPGPADRLMNLGTLRDAALAFDDAGTPGWPEDVAARFVAVREAGDSDLTRYLRRHVETMRGQSVLSVGGWVAGLPPVDTIRARFPGVTGYVIREALVAIYREDHR